MPSVLGTLKLLADPTRARILRLLRRQEVSVAELQEILSMGQSRISTQLSQLKKEGLVEDRRSGKHILYGLSEDGALPPPVLEVLELAAKELPESKRDDAALELVLKKRTDKARAYFDQLAGKFGRQYVPGRSWKSLAETLIKLMPPKVIADLGAGEGTLSQLLAQRAEKVIAVDNSEKMVDFGGRAAKDNGFKNLEYRVGDIEKPPIDDEAVDLALFSQALHHAATPKAAVAEAHRILKPGGHVVVLDLLKHQFEEARELYADEWLGFSEIEILDFLKAAGFEDIEITVVDREKESPNFQTLLAIATKK
ncbi:MAG: metalloregulator ArsR/SmtB family transcription factor [Verrucomicrobiota bacterium]